ncbi:MAG: two-component regulator propeller domain-containing protein, partial [Melioribacteraceae bacterium]|nr:two-component regulator propeller domain-containing protein [Melioribacteraceae bacterium]
MKKYSYIFILLIFSSHFVAQTLKSNFSRITQEDGLPSNEVSSLLQDHLGYIWIGTNNGVSIYDGYDVHNFSVVNDDPNFLQHPLVSSLYEDSKNNIWIGSVGGITKYDRNKKSFRLYPFDDIQEMQERELVTLSTYETSSGDIIIGLTDFYYRNINSGLLTIKNGVDSLEIIQLANNDTADVIFQISSTGNDRFLISGFQGLGEYNHHDRSISWFPIKNNYTVVGFLQDTSNIVWLGTIWGEVYKYNLLTTEYETVNLPNPKKGERFFIIYKIIFDQNRNLLIATNKGLYQYNISTKEITSVTYDLRNPSALHSMEIRDIIIDRTASMWLATRIGGISKYNLVQSSFQSYKNNPNDPKSIEPGWVNTIFELNPNEIWFRAEGNIISRFDKKDKSFKNDAIPSNTYIEYILRDKFDQIWMAGSSNLYKFNHEKWELQNVNCPIENTAIHVLFEDSRSTFWIGTQLGLFTYDRENNLVAKIDFDKLGIGSPNSNSIYLIVEDSLNNIWFGSEDGLFNYNYKEKHYTRFGNSQDSSKALNSQNINALYVDNTGILWVGTWLGGLNRVDISSDYIKSFSKEDGFKSHSVQGILGDEENGALWLSSFDGLSRFDISEEKFQHFGIS